MTTENTFIPIPPELPKPPACEEGFWLKYLGKEIRVPYPFYEGSRPVYFYCYDDDLGWTEMFHYGFPQGIKGRHYLEKVAINYDDPAYQKYVEHACKNGANILMNSKLNNGSEGGWIPMSRDDRFSWGVLEYRIAPNQPAPSEPYYSSKEYQKSVLDAAWDGKDCESFLPVKREWSPANIHQVVFAISKGINVRIKPTETKPQTVKVPLKASDVPPVCWIRAIDDTCSFMITAVGKSHLQFHDNTGAIIREFDLLVDRYEYSTDRINWLPCYTVETK